MPNHLANESSPYLLQHQNNPVNWYPWGDEAIQLAKSTKQPIFLSIGYSACHWCHVMEHESFENEAIAEFLNSNFVSIKVDREERPDLDQIYMNAVQMISGRGGWPMSVFLTPDLQPFFGGTYWPPMTKMGMPGFDHVLAAVLDAWNNRREQAIEQAAELTERIARIGASTVADRDLNPDECMRSAAVNLEQAFDFTFGGFGGAPKFPHSMDLQVLLRIWKKNPRDGILGMVSLTLDRMAAGGIYDHLAGGFARYSVDARWLVPHFEKMLYDNALLTLAYLEAYQATGNEFYQQTITETLSYILNYMTDTDGGFHSTEDADSEGEEGKFYVWNPSEIAEILGAAAAERFCYVYDVSEEGNFEGKSILNLPKSIEQCAKIKNWNIHEIKTRLAEDRAKLLSERDRRIRPAKDDKIIVSWNGLMIDAMARAGAVLGNEKYISAAKKAANFIRERLYDSKGRLLHTYRHGEAKLAAYLDDYACFANACVSLYQATFDEEWISRALQLMEDVLDRFSDSAGGALFYTADDHEQLIARNKDLYDSSVPSGNAMAAYVLARLGKLTGQSQLLETAYAIIRSAAGVIQQSPTASGQMLIALDLISEGSFELVLLGGKDPQENASLVRLLQSKFLPNCVLAYRDEESSANSVLDGLFAGRSVKPDPQLFVCEGTACREPVLGCDNIIDILATL